MTTPYPRALILIGGFRQSLGLAKLDEALCRKYPSRKIVRIYSVPWNHNALTLANQIRYCHESPDTDIRIAAFSWGNPTALHLARELRKSGHCIEQAVLCDPVPRSLGCLPLGSIRVPDNVRRVSWLHQCNEHWIMRAVNGRKPVADDPAQTKIEDGILIPRAAHVWCDDSPLFTAAVTTAFDLPYSLKAG